MERIKVRLSRPYDFDLYCLYLTVGKKRFAQIMRDILKCYVDGTEYQAQHISEWHIPEPGDKGIAVTSYLSIGEDSEAAKLLSSIEGGKAAAFIKCLVRIYYGTALVQVYLPHAEAAYIPEKPKPPRVTTKPNIPEPVTPEPKEQETPIELDEGADFDALSDLFGGITEI